MKKVALVTGASSGIGFIVAQRLIESGYVVYAVARRLELMDELKSQGCNILYLDLMDKKSIEECVLNILKKENKIDILINNAGFGLGGCIENISTEEAKKQFDVNVFGLIKLIQLVLPGMKNQKDGLIVNVSSIAGKFSTPFSGWYHATKYSVEALSDALRLEVSNFGIKVVLVEPGLIQTSWGIIHANNIRKYSDDFYAENAEKVAEYFEKRYSRGKKLSKPEIIANLIIKIINKKNPKPRYSKGKMSFVYLISKKIFPDRFFDFLLKFSFGIK